MSGPTSGPWQFTAALDGSWKIQAPGDPDTAPILCARSRWPSRAAESHANGLLMWAARDLLDICRQARHALATLGLPHHDGCGCAGCDALRVLDIAILRATGTVRYPDDDSVMEG